MIYLDETIEIFILTHDKTIVEDYDEKLYFPLVCGGGIADYDDKYLYDDFGDNISDLNKYYSELTGEYWAWKNTSQDIVGFCHYRRWFVKNFKWEKITRNDILNDLMEYDIILPKKMRFNKSLYEFHKELNIKRPNYDVRYEDYVKVSKVLEEFFPDYFECYNNVMNGNYIWTNNMFICKKRLANQYFEWLFDVLNRINYEVDLSKYDSRDSRIFGFIAERLFTCYILKNHLKYKEYNIFLNERKFPILHPIRSRFPILNQIENIVGSFIKNF